MSNWVYGIELPDDPVLLDFLWYAAEEFIGKYGVEWSMRVCRSGIEFCFETDADRSKFACHVRAMLSYSVDDTDTFYRGLAKYAGEIE